MKRPFSLLLTLSLCAAGLAAPTSALAGQDLTPVQRAFVDRKAVTMIPEVEAAPDTATLLWRESQAVAAQGPVPAPRSGPPLTPEGKTPRFSKVLLYSLELTFYEHVMRVATQDFTRSELEGPYFQDWFDSVHFPKKWNDLDSWEVNYLGHAIHGSAATRIWLEQKEPKATTKAQYAKSMTRAFLFTVLFSEQYEIGPMSEASIGNVGLRAGRTGWVDHIWTPVGAVLWAMAEDAIDKYFLTQVDKHVPFLMARAAARMILNPGRMLANIGMNRVPWDRPGRPLTANLYR